MLGRPWSKISKLQCHHGHQRCHFSATGVVLGFCWAACVCGTRRSSGLRSPPFHKILEGRWRKDWFHTSRLLNSNIIRSRCMTPKITAHYCELTWFRPWFHLVPHVGKNAKSQLTIGNWFGSWFGSTWFRMLAEAPNLSSLLGIDLVLDLVPLGSKAVKRNVAKSHYQQCIGDPLA